MTETEHKEKRKAVLTEADLEAIAERIQCNNCAFSEAESATLRSFAKSINTTQRVASWVIITGTVTAVLSGIWKAVTFYLNNVILKGGGHG